MPTTQRTPACASRQRAVFSAVVAAVLITAGHALAIGQKKYPESYTHGIPEMQSYEATSAQISAIDARATTTLDALLARSPEAASLAEGASGILVFPEITRAGVIVGAASGVGVLREDGATTSYLQMEAVTVGLQLGMEKFEAVLMFMGPEPLEKFQATPAIRLGSDATVATIEGSGDAVRQKDLEADVIAFISDEKGLFMGATMNGVELKRIQVVED